MNYKRYISHEKELFKPEIIILNRIWDLGSYNFFFKLLYFELAINNE